MAVVNQEIGWEMQTRQDVGAAAGCQYLHLLDVFAHLPYVLSAST
jgi:hypothetical protein